MSRFEGHLDLQLLDGRGGRPETRGGRSLWSLTQPLAYTTKAGDRILVPAGFITDLASIPRIFWNIFPPDGAYAEAAVIHDCLYFTRGGLHLWNGQRVITRDEPYSRAGSDEVLDEAMADLDRPIVERVPIFAGVRVGGWIGWGN